MKEYLSKCIGRLLKLSLVSREGGRAKVILDKELDMILTKKTILDAEDKIKYRISDVTNNGKRLFHVNPNTGISSFNDCF